MDEDNQKNEMIQIIQRISEIPQETKDIISEYIRDNGYSQFMDKFNVQDTEKNNYLDMMNEEYELLANDGGNYHQQHFQIEPSKPVCLNNKMIPDFSIAAVSKIRTVTAQRGYYRLVGSSEENQPAMISVAYKTADNTEIWFPGYEGFGEGIFLNFDKESLDKIPHAKTYDNWKKFDPKKTQLDDEELIRHYTRPEYVWLHSLSHVLIKAISEFTGYSVTAVRERVYYDTVKQSGGILIYNTTPGEDGSLGGLTSLTNDFKEIVDRACELIFTCSNDPLCYDIHREGGQVTGSACYGCLLIPETSCEHRNRWLDRHIFFNES